MKDLKVILDLKTQTWNIEDIDDFNKTTEVLFGVRQVSPTVLFDNLKFGFTLLYNGNVVQEFSDPPVGTTYICSDQEYLKSIPIGVTYNQTYTLLLWAENAGVRYEFDYTFTTPKPNQPYPSWTWVDQTQSWEPPVPRPIGPDVNVNMVWSEQLQTWLQPNQSQITLPEHGVFNPNTGLWEEIPTYDVE